MKCKILIYEVEDSPYMMFEETYFINYPVLYPDGSTGLLIREVCKYTRIDQADFETFMSTVAGRPLTSSDLTHAACLGASQDETIAAHMIEGDGLKILAINFKIEQEVKESLTNLEDCV